MIPHDWQYCEDLVTPSGKILYRCSKCGLFECAPVKDEYETRLCIPRRYEEMPSWVRKFSDVFGAINEQGGEVNK